MKHPESVKTFLVDVLKNLKRVSKLRAIDNAEMNTSSKEHERLNNNLLLLVFDSRNKLWLGC